MLDHFGFLAPVHDRVIPPLDLSRLRERLRLPSTGVCWTPVAAQAKQIPGMIAARGLAAVIERDQQFTAWIIVDK